MPWRFIRNNKVKLFGKSFWEPFFFKKWLPKYSLFAVLLFLAAFSSACRKNEEGKTLSSMQVSNIRVQKFELTDEDKSLLLQIARKTVESWVKDRKREEFNIPPERVVLLEKGAAFVTLRKDGELRGCIGHTIPQEPLWMCVRDVAISAASEDPRFRPVSADELKDIHIEVSVLTPLEPVTDVENIVMGKDGVVVRKGYRVGVFLPQVAHETGWNRETFLSNLCAHKAGLPPDCWKDPSTYLFRFQAIVFEEKKGKKTF